jgi:AraC-like DNA-binding protein
MNLRPKEAIALSQIKTFIESQYNQHLTIKELSKRSWAVTHQEITTNVIFSPVRLQMGFKSIFLLTIHEYQTEVRMEKAKVLLATTDQSIKSIALSIGFSGSNNFAPAFKRHFDLTPSAYRNKFMSM